MIIPFEQMAEDHRRDVRIIETLYQHRIVRDLSRGHKMWLMATVGFGYMQSSAMIDVQELKRKYPKP
jgi:hypothetical protein